MKKLLTLLCALILMMTCTSALAESTAYDLPELGITLALPDTVMAFTAETEESVFALQGMDKDAIIEAMKAMDTYMLIHPFDWNIEINVVMTENRLENLDGMDEATMELLAGAIKQALESQGVTVRDYNVYQAGANQYFRHFYDVDVGNGSTNYAVQYYIIKNHKAIVLRMFSYEGMPLTEEQNALLQQIVDGVSFN